MQLEDNTVWLTQYLIATFFQVAISKSTLDAESKGLIQVITEYTRALSILDHYDHDKLKIPKEVERERSE